VAEVVGHKARVVRVAVAVHFAHLRNDVRDGGVADHHQVERFPAAALPFRLALADPERIVPADERLRNDVELEDMRELVVE